MVVRPPPPRSRTGWTVRRNGWSAVWPREHRPLAPPWRRADAHLTGFIVPLDEAGHLNARKWIGGAARCRQQQTDYAAAVAPLGLSRGIEGSTAQHERVRRHYGQIAAPVAPLQIDRPRAS